MTTLTQTRPKTVEIIHFLQFKFATAVNPDLYSVELSEDENGFSISVRYRNQNKDNYQRYLVPVSKLISEDNYNSVFSPKHDFEYKVDQFINLPPFALKHYIKNLFNDEQQDFLRINQVIAS